MLEQKQSALNIPAIRAQFPILQESMHGNTLVYLDSANTTQKPNSVILATENFYTHSNANIHRSVYLLSERATKICEGTRDKVSDFINAKHRHEIIFTKGTTDGINLIASSLGQNHFQPGDEILISAMEHHSNIVPWQWICEKTGAQLKIIPVHDNGELDLVSYEQLLTPHTKLVAVTHVSNVLGTINPVADIITKAHHYNIPVLLDGAQAAPHLSVDVQALDCDFYIFSAHKMYGPTGVGIIYGKEKWLNVMPPYQGGGSMIREVTFAKTTYAELPYKFEAGTGNLAGIAGFGAAIDFLSELDLANIQQYEHHLLKYAEERLQKIAGVRLIGTAAEKAGVISFVLENIHPHDVGTVLDSDGIAVRVGHHCAMPLMARFNVPATIRVSFGVYNTLEEIDRLVESLLRVKRLFQS